MYYLQAQQILMRNIVVILLQLMRWMASCFQPRNLRYTNVLKFCITNDLKN